MDIVRKYCMRMSRDSEAVHVVRNSVFVVCEDVGSEHTLHHASDIAYGYRVSNRSLFECILELEVCLGTAAQVLQDIDRTYTRRSNLKEEQRAQERIFQNLLAFCAVHWQYIAV